MESKAVDDEDANKGQVIIAQWDFTAEKNDELDVKAGQRMLTLDKIEEWWYAEILDDKGERTGECGYIPAVYCSVDQSMDSEVVGPPPSVAEAEAMVRSAEKKLKEKYEQLENHDTEKYNDDDIDEKFQVDLVYVQESGEFELVILLENVKHISSEQNSRKSEFEEAMPAVTSTEFEMQKDTANTSKEIPPSPVASGSAEGRGTEEEVDETFQVDMNQSYDTEQEYLKRPEPREIHVNVHDTAIGEIHTKEPEINESYYIEKLLSLRTRMEELDLITPSEVEQIVRSSGVEGKTKEPSPPPPPPPLIEASRYPTGKAKHAPSSQASPQVLNPAIAPPPPPPSVAEAHKQLLEQRLKEKQAEERERVKELENKRRQLEKEVEELERKHQEREKLQELSQLRATQQRQFREQEQMRQVEKEYEELNRLGVRDNYMRKLTPEKKPGKRELPKELTDAVEVVTKAVNADNAKNFSEAYQLYSQALDLFTSALRTGRITGSTLKKVVERMEGYVARLYKLEKALPNQTRKKNMVFVLTTLCNNGFSGAVEKGDALYDEAFSFDSKGMREKALKSYTQSLEYFMAYHHHCKHNKTQTPLALMGKITSTLERAETIKARLL